MNVTEAIQRTVEHREIFHDEMLDLMRQIMSGGLSPVQIAAVMMGLRVKKETVGEITAAAQVMREFATPVLGVTAMPAAAGGISMAQFGSAVGIISLIDSDCA